MNGGALFAGVQHIERIAERIDCARQAKRPTEDVRFEPTTRLLACGGVAFRAAMENIESRSDSAGIDQPLFGYFGSPIPLAQLNRILADAGGTDHFQHHLGRTVQL
jgi:hypothetical protein